MDRDTMGVPDRSAAADTDTDELVKIVEVAAGSTVEEVEGVAEEE